jgi:hypothetical protein
MQNGTSRAVRHKTHGANGANGAVKASQREWPHGVAAFRREYPRYYPAPDSVTLEGQIGDTLALYAAFGLAGHPDCEADLAPLRAALADARKREQSERDSYFSDDCFPLSSL